MFFTGRFELLGRRRGVEVVRGGDGWWWRRWLYSRRNGDSKTNMIQYMVTQISSSSTIPDSPTAPFTRSIYSATQHVSILLQPPTHVDIGGGRGERVQPYHTKKRHTIPRKSLCTEVLTRRSRTESGLGLTFKFDVNQVRSTIHEVMSPIWHESCLLYGMSHVSYMA